MTSSPRETGDQDAPPSLYDLLGHDAEALAAVSRGYTGPHDVLDAVWWSEHPLEPTPAGRPDPAGELRALKSQAFSRTGSADAAATLAAFEGRLRRDTEALARAVRDARPALSAAADRLRQENAAVASPAFERELETRAGAAAIDTSRSIPERRGLTPDRPPAALDRPANAAALAWRRRSQIWMWTAIAAGLLLLVGVGVVVEQQLDPGPQFVSAGAAAGGDGEATTEATETPRGLKIFEDPERAPRIPPANIDPYYKPESLRLLGVADSELTVYAVENRIDQPCLLAVYTDGTQSATCVTKQEFAAMGIELRLTSLRAATPGEPAPARAAQDVVFWNEDGSYGVSSRPSTPAPTPSPTTVP